MKETFRIMRTLQEQTNILHSNCVIFNQKLVEYADFKSDGGVEITEDELRSLVHFAEHIQYASEKFLFLCNEELKQKSMESLFDAVSQEKC